MTNCYVYRLNIIILENYISKKIAEFFNASLGALHGHLNLHTPPGSVQRTVVKALNSSMNLRPTPSRAVGGI
jgi:hypothetical protein